MTGIINTALLGFAKLCFPRQMLLRALPEWLVVGGSCTLKFKTAKAIDDFLPCRGTSGALRQSYINPTTNLGAFAGQVVALRLSVDFSNAGITASGVGEC